MATITMREIREGEVPPDGGTAVQEDPDRPVFSGNGPDDYVCVECGNVLAAAMEAVQMTKRCACAAGAAPPSTWRSPICARRTTCGPPMSCTGA